MKPKIRNIIFICVIIIFLLTFIIAGTSLLRYIASNNQSASTYNNAQQAIQIETHPLQNEVPQKQDNDSQEIENVEDIEIAVDPYEELKIKIDVDWALLNEQSEDVVGWIYIPDTNINFPLVQKDNQYYLDHDYMGNYNSGGAIFLDRYVDMNSKNIIIYGHNMGADIMFHRLRNYKDQEYADNHKYVYIATEDFVRIYELFSVVYADKASDTYTWEFDEENQMKFEDYLNRSKENSIISTTVEANQEKSLLSLSTCSGRTKSERLVVQAILLTEY